MPGSLLHCLPLNKAPGSLTACLRSAAIASLCVGMSADREWQLARAPGSGCWPPRCTSGELPLATPLVAHQGKLVMIGDGSADVAYESSDGKNWRGFAHNARWGTRYKAAHASYRGSIWRAGGWVDEAGRRRLMNDVWRSTDGRRWQRVVAAAPWSPRSDAHMIAFRDTLWLVGGETHDTNLWFTTDGLKWLPRRAPDLPRANPQAVLVHRDAVWILGHGAWEKATNDVWKSSDMATWTRVTARSDWPPRTGAGFAVLDDKIWIAGGSGHRDVWSSSDGRRWTRSPGDLPGPPRAANYSVVFQDRFWVFGGKTGGLGGTGFWDGVVYLK